MEKKLNILMCCHLPLNPKLGGAKVYLEAAEVYRFHGHSVTLLGIDEVVGNDKPFMDENWRFKHYPLLLREYLLNLNSQFDVIEYESIYLPFNLKKQLKSILVARSVLLDLHLKTIKLPHFKGLKAYVGNIFKSKSRLIKLNNKIQQSMLTMHYSDFVNVPNPCDKNILIVNGILPGKIIVQPYGIFNKKFKLFQSIKFQNNKQLDNIKIAFVGTFDNRKGAVEFPEIIRKILTTHTNVEFKFLGAAGMFADQKSIRNYLGDEFQDRISIHCHYFPEDLPELLKDCSFGIFPSYLESFGFGVLEMMAMGLPVVGYNSPGINMLLIDNLIVNPGNIFELLALFSRLINDEEFKDDCIKKSKLKVRNYIYENQTSFSLQAYEKKIRDKAIDEFQEETSAI